VPIAEAAAAGAPAPRLSLVLLGAVLLSWPSALNWHPYLFWDSYGYFLQGEAYARLIAARAGLLPPPPEVGPGWIGAAARMLARDPAIRSPSFSLLFYALAAGGGFWLVAALNAFVAAATLELASARLFRLSPPRRLAVLLVLAATSSLPWFASYLMPDLHAGLLVLAAATLVFARERLRGGERAALLLLWLLSATFHSSHLLLAAALTGLAPWLSPRGSRRAILLRLGPALAGALALLLAAGWLGFGRPTPTAQAPPFLLARSWEDGPARVYLEAACGRGEGWAICPHLATLPPTAQGFLWDPEHSYWAMDLATRAAVRAQEGAILARAVAARPLPQAWASLRNGALQLGRFGLDDLVVGRGAAVTARDYTFLYLPEAPAARWGLGGFSALIYAATAASLAALLARLVLRRGGRRSLRLAVFVLAGIVLNAAVCGALSGPHDRYQARVAWLVPLLATGLLLQPRRRSGPGSAVSPARRAPGPGAP
jgi:hypothetical protein